MSLVNETKAIDKPASSDLIPDDLNTISSSSSSSNRQTLKLSPSFDLSSHSEPPLIDAIINPYGAQLIMDLFHGDLGLITLLGEENAERAQTHTDDASQPTLHDTVCIFLF